MTTSEVQIPRNPTCARHDQDRIAYRARGRCAVRDWLIQRVRGPDPDAEARTALRLGLAPERLVRFWALEDLFADPALELAARIGYPQLAGAFAALDTARREAAACDQAQRAERDLKRALARTDH